jgi:ligand-binding sensor domain-containing protein
MKRIGILLAFIFLSFEIHHPTCFSSEWATYTNMNNISEVLLDGEKLFCATTGGLIILDTESDSITQITNVEGLGGNYLYSATQDSLGNFWFGAQNGTLSKYKYQTGFIQVYLFEQDGNRLKIRKIVPDADKLWVASGNQVSLFLIERNYGEVKENYKRFGEIQPDTVFCVALAEDKVWVGTDKGLAFAKRDDPNINLQDPSNWTSFSKNGFNGLTTDCVKTVLYFEGKIYLGTDQGVFRFIDSTMTFDTIGLNGYCVNDLKTFDNKIYVATDHGVFFYDGAKWDSVTASGLLTAKINSLSLDSSGKIWAGTAGKGLSSYSNQQWKNYLLNGPAGNIFEDMVMDRNGKLWCANSGDGVCSFDGESWTTYSSVFESLLGGHFSEMFSIAADSQNNIWVGSWGSGGFMLDQDGNWHRYSDTNSLLSDAAGYPGAIVVNDIFVDEYNNKWFLNEEAYDGEGIVALNGSCDTCWISFNHSDGLVDVIFNHIFAWGDHLWIAHKWSGLSDFNYKGTLLEKGDDIWTHYSTDKLSGEDAQCVNIDKNGVLWVGTNNGLRRLDPYSGNFEKVSWPKDLGLQVNAISVDKYNNKWIGTSDGLGVLIEKDAISFNVFKTSNSDLAFDVINCLAINDQTGEIWIGTPQGLSRYSFAGETPTLRLSDVFPFPNPVIIKTGEEKVNFLAPAQTVGIKIYTTAGEQIKDGVLVDPLRGRWEWDLKNKDGELVASGVYLFYVYNEKGNSALGKIAVIREE